MNCKVGDLAIAIRALHPENIGAIVEVLAPGNDPTLLPFWHVKSVGRALKFTYDKSPQDQGYAEDVFMYDFQLRPIRPDEIVGDVLASNPMILDAIERREVHEESVVR